MAHDHHDPTLTADDGPLTPIERVSRPFHLFGRLKGSGALVLLAATISALILANSEAADQYFELLGNYEMRCAANTTQLPRKLFVALPKCHYKTV